MPSRSMERKPATLVVPDVTDAILPSRMTIEPFSTISPYSHPEFEASS